MIGMSIDNFRVHICPDSGHRLEEMTVEADAAIDIIQ